MNSNFENPYYLLFLLALPLYILWKSLPVFRGRFREAALPFPSLASVKKGDAFAWAASLLQDALILGAVAALAVALARPRGGSAVSQERNLGVDIALVHDVSGSMDFVDEPPSGVRRQGDQFFDLDGRIKEKSRLNGAKRVMKNYIDKQQNNRLALVLFGTYALTKSPLSSDKELLKTLTDEIQTFEDGTTAIGTGILTGLNRLKNSAAKSKVMILLTDGANNAGIVDPITAANAARELGVRVYTVGFGTTEGYLYPLDRDKTIYGLGDTAEFNEDVLAQIAQITGGRYFHARNETSLQSVYDEIDKLEKSEYDIKRRVLYEEKFTVWLQAAAVLLMCWAGMSALVLRIP